MPTQRDYGLREPFLKFSLDSPHTPAWSPVTSLQTDAARQLMAMALAPSTQGNTLCRTSVRVMGRTFVGCPYRTEVAFEGRPQVHFRRGS